MHVSQVQYIVQVVDGRVGMQRDVPTIETADEIVEVPQIEYMEKVVSVPLELHRQSCGRISDDTLTGPDDPQSSEDRGDVSCAIISRKRW